MGRAMAGTGLDRLSVLPSGLAHQRHTMRRIGIAMSGSPNPVEIIDLVVFAERLGSASTGVAEGLAATSAPCLVACAMRTSRILGAGPRSSWMPGSCETSVCDHGGVPLARPALHICGWFPSRCVVQSMRGITAVSGCIRVLPWNTPRPAPVPQHAAHTLTSRSSGERIHPVML